jgi:hypothetical protein
MHSILGEPRRRVAQSGDIHGGHGGNCTRSKRRRRQPHGRPSRCIIGAGNRAETDNYVDSYRFGVLAIGVGEGRAYFAPRPLSMMPMVLTATSTSSHKEKCLA